MRIFDFFRKDCFVAAFLSMPPFIAIPSFAADDEMTVSVPEYVEIKKSNSVITSGSTVQDAYNMQLSNNLVLKYYVENNLDVDVYFSVYCSNSSGEMSPAMLYYKEGKYIVAFSNKDNIPSKSSVESITNSNNISNYNVASNSNVIAFFMVPDQNNKVNMSGNDADSTFYGRTIYHKIYPGNTLLAYKINNSSIENTFSPHDSAGVYTSTVYVTTVAP